MHHEYDFWGPPHRPRPRGSYFGRGGIKFAILDLLQERPRHGYDIIREIEERSGGEYTPSPGVVYPTLQALEDQDYVRSTEEEGKRVYAITEAGIAYLEGHKEQKREHHGKTHRADDDRGHKQAKGPEGDSGPAAEDQGEGARDAGGRDYEGRASGGFGAWFTPGEMPEMMKELRWFFTDFAGAIQRTVADPQKIKEIRQVLRQAKHDIDEIVMR